MQRVKKKALRSKMNRSSHMICYISKRYPILPNCLTLDYFITGSSQRAALKLIQHYNSVASYISPICLTSRILELTNF